MRSNGQQSVPAKQECWLDRLSPEEQKAKKLLILDGGGGALLHLTAPFDVPPCRPILL